MKRDYELLMLQTGAGLLVGAGVLIGLVTTLFGLIGLGNELYLHLRGPTQGQVIAARIERREVRLTQERIECFKAGRCDCVVLLPPEGPHVP